MACGAAGAAAAVAAAAESASLEALLREALSVRGIPTRATKVLDLQAVRGRGYQPGRFQLLIAGHRQVANEPCSASARSPVGLHSSGRRKRKPRRSLHVSPVRQDDVRALQRKAGFSPLSRPEASQQLLSVDRLTFLLRMPFFVAKLAPVPCELLSAAPASTIMEWVGHAAGTSAGMKRQGVFREATGTRQQSVAPPPFGVDPVTSQATQARFSISSATIGGNKQQRVIDYQIREEPPRVGAPVANTLVAAGRRPKITVGAHIESGA